MSKQDAGKPTPPPANIAAQRTREDLQISRRCNDILTSMHALYGHIRSHGEDHPRVVHDAKKIVTLISRTLAPTADASIDIEITTQGFEYHAITLLSAGDRARELTTPFLSHGIGRFIIDRQVTEAEIAALLTAVTNAPSTDGNSFEAVSRELIQKQVANILIQPKDGDSPQPTAEPLLNSDTKMGTRMGTKMGAKVVPRPDPRHESAVKKPRPTGEPRQLYLALVGMMKEIHGQLAQGAEFQTRELAELTADLAEIMRDRARYILPYAMVRRFDRYDCVHPVNACILAVSAIGSLIENHRDRQLLIQSILLMDAGLFATGELTDVASSTVATDYTGNPVRGAIALDRMAALSKLPMIIAFEQHLQNDFTGYPTQPYRWRLNYITAIVSVAEQFDALTSGRTPLCPNQALTQLATRIGGAITSEAFDALYSAVGPYPPGSLVELENGEIAVVLRYKVPMRVRMITDSSKRLLSDPHTMTASLPGGKKAEGLIVRAVDANTFPVSVFDYLG